LLEVRGLSLQVVIRKALELRLEVIDLLYQGLEAADLFFVRIE
jgi:hypothetical protein